MLQTRSYTESARILMAILGMVILAKEVTYPSKAQQPAQQSESENLHATRDLATEIGDGRVQTLEILMIPADIETNASITPAQLERQYSYKITIPRLRSSRQEKSLVQALVGTHLTKFSGQMDLRWELKFTMDNGKVRALFVDRFGGHGVIDGAPVAIKGNLYSWLRSTFSCLD